MSIAFCGLWSLLSCEDNPHTSSWHSMIDFADFADFSSDFADFANFSSDFADFADFSSDFADFLVLNLVYLCYDIKDQKVNLAGIKLVCSSCVKHQRKIRKKISKIRKIRSGDRAL